MPRSSRKHPLDDRMRIEHMRLAAQDVREFCVGRSRSDLDADTLLRRAVIHAIQEIGEAATRVSDDGRSRAPQIPWRVIVGMRHLLVHVYFHVNLDAVWKVVTDDIEPLIKAIDAACADWPLPPSAPDGSPEQAP